ncbi:MAG: MATE family efflux transporter, partial [Candidatus Marinimicrobia bacterium]|nr:MATE family efflux transporter [Candidatus Neomarinimicrobiota bacterium]
MTIPMIFGMMSMVIFNLADTFFVGKLGADELAALSFTFPVVMVVNSIAVGIGLGSSAVISKLYGQENYE